LPCGGLHVFSDRELLGHLSNEQFEKLERALCSAEGLGTLNRSKKDTKSKTCASKKMVSLSGEEENNASPVSTPISDTPLQLASSSPEQVFEPRPPQSSREGK